jgi:hypothetical protein
MLGGFVLLILQFSFWSVIGVAYLGAIGLLVLIAFTRRVSDKGSRSPNTAGSQN